MGDPGYRGGPVRRGGGGQVHLAGEPDARGRRRHQEPVAGALLGVVGFFVVPVLGLVLGFVLGVFLVELLQRHDARRAWVSTVHALKGVALSVGVELTGAVLAALTWAVAVLAF